MVLSSPNISYILDQSITHASSVGLFAPIGSQNVHDLGDGIAGNKLPACFKTGLFYLAAGARAGSADFLLIVYSTCVLAALNGHDLTSSKTERWG